MNRSLTSIPSVCVLLLAACSGGGLGGSNSALPRAVSVNSGAIRSSVRSAQAQWVAPCMQTSGNHEGEPCVTPSPSSTASPLTSIDAGGPAASAYVADAGFSGGTVSRGTTHAIDTSMVGDPAPQEVYQTARYGNFTYSFPNLTAGQAYTLRLHFAEYIKTAIGQRVFNVGINGTPALTNYDVFAQAGMAYKAITADLPATADASGTIVVSFVNIPGKDHAIVQGLQLVSGTTPTPTSTPSISPSASPSPSSSASPSATPSASPMPTIPPGSFIHLKNYAYIGNNDIVAYNDARTRQWLQWLDYAEILKAGRSSVAPAKALKPELKVGIYSDPHIIYHNLNDPMTRYGTDPMHAVCPDGSRMNATLGSNNVYFLDVRTSEASDAYAKVRDVTVGSIPLDFLFADDAISPPAVYGSGKNCSAPSGYDASTWANAEGQFLTDAMTKSTAGAAGLPVLASGGKSKNGGVYMTDGMQNSPAYAGSVDENCFESLRNSANGPYVTHGWRECVKTELRLQHYSPARIWVALSNDYEPASGATDLRIYNLASFLVAYDLNTDFTWTTMTTASHFRVQPETGFVPLNPLIATPGGSSDGDVASLQCGSGVFCREYADCYYLGTRVGACGVAVNPTAGSGSRSVNWPSGSTYRGAMHLTGSGVVQGTDNGTVDFNGSPPGMLCAPPFSGCTTAEIVIK